MIKRYLLCLSVSALLLSCAEPPSSSATKEPMSKDYVELDETIAPLIARFNSLDDSLKLVFIVGPT